MTRRNLIQTGLGLIAPALARAAEGEWQPLFDGKTLDGWVANENPDSFSVENGAIVAHGSPRSHLFYAGPVGGGRFENFELHVAVKTKPNSNGGIYFHSAMQPGGWPEKGFEVQVNNTYKDKRKTGSLYGVADVLESPARDEEWFSEQIRVSGRRVTIQVNGKAVIDWTQPKDWQGLSVREKGRPFFPERKLSSGAFALQAHDPDSVVLYRDIRVRLLP